MKIVLNIRYGVLVESNHIVEHGNGLGHVVITNVNIKLTDSILMEFGVF